ncbi:hypothetical protein OSB04_019883 [Centaurea solstitialis]|uniref:BED-type domain-containing protein n=1 Tax=Centaurea solstitialis TaxID=347529 RepID=A0AA38WCS3_9ASTR|nr:hypothetical protein OSB04_019883 [Centaurea solstitialis]
MSQSQANSSAPTSEPKKRKAVETRSQVWDHFEKSSNKEGILIVGKCEYCGKTYAADPKKDGTSSLKNHMIECLKNPHVKETRQSMLVFQSSKFENESVLSSWVFNQDNVRKALTRMVIIDELSFKFVEGRGFKKFVEESCPMFKIPSRWTINRDVYGMFFQERSNLKNGVLEKHFSILGCSSVRVQYLHMRCITHTLNLVVRDGLKMADPVVTKLRDTVQWLTSSPARVSKFKELASLLGVGEKSSLCLDVPSRWNSTYMMLQTAILYRVVFKAYEGHDASFKSDLGDSMLADYDWDYLESFIYILQAFYEMTLKISGSPYVNSNSYLTEISELSYILANMMVSQNRIEQNIGKTMKEKFDKYWGDPDNMNLVIFFASIVDPRDKVEYMPFQLRQLYGEAKGDECFNMVKSKLTSLFEDYVAEYSTSKFEPSNVQSQPEKCTPIGSVRSRLISRLKKQTLESGALEKKKSELELYLSEAVVDDSDDLDVLSWWKLNCERFPVLSKIARDLLAVPISTVASESMFSTSGRVLDDFRSSLTPKILEAFICTQDWLRESTEPILVEENLNEIEKFEKGTSTTLIHQL